MMRWVREGLHLVRRCPAVLLTAALTVLTLELGMIVLSSGTLPIPVPTLRVVTGPGSTLGLVLALLLALGVAPLLEVGLLLVAYGLRRGGSISPLATFLPLVRRPRITLVTYWSVVLRMLLASLLLIVPGVLRALAWVFAPFLSLVVPYLNPRDLSATLLHGHRGRMFVVLVLFAILATGGDVLAFFAGLRWVPGGFGIWMAIHVIMHAWLAGVLASAFDELISMSPHEGTIRAELDQVLASTVIPNARPVVLALPFLVPLALLVGLAPKSVADFSNLEPVVVVPPPPPAHGAHCLLGSPYIEDVCVIPDGERVAVLTNNALEIRRWADLQILASFPADGFASKLAVSPEGDLVAGGGIVVDLRRSEVVGRYPHSWQEALAFNRAGTQLLVASLRRASRSVGMASYDPRGGTVVWEMEMPLKELHWDTRVVSVEFSPTGSHVLLVLCGGIYSLHSSVLDLATGAVVRERKGYGLWTPEGDLLLFSLPEGPVELVNLDTGMSHDVMTLRPSSQTWLRFETCLLPRIVLSADGRRVAVVVGQTEVQVWDLSRKRRVATFDLVWRREKRLVLRFFIPSALLLELPVALEKRIQRRSGHVNIHLSAAGDRLAFLTGFQLVLAELDTGRKRAWETRDYPGSPRFVWLPDGTGIVSEGLVVWDVQTGVPRGRIWEAFEEVPLGVFASGLILTFRSFSNFKGEMVTELRAWPAYLWQRKAELTLSGGLRWAAVNPGQNVATLVLYLPDDRRSAPAIFTVVEVTPPEGRVDVLFSSEEGAEFLALSPSGRHVAFYQGEVLAVAEVRTGRLIAELEVPRPREVAISSDDRWMAVAWDEHFGVWDMVEGQEIWSAPVAAKYLVFHPRRGLLAGLVKTGSVVLWDCESGEELFTLGPIHLVWWSYHAYATPYLAFSPDGQWIALTHDEFILVWPCPLGDDSGRIPSERPL